MAYLISEIINIHIPNYSYTTIMPKCRAAATAAATAGEYVSGETYSTLPSLPLIQYYLLWVVDYGVRTAAVDRHTYIHLHTTDLRHT